MLLMPFVAFANGNYLMANETLIMAQIPSKSLLEPKFQVLEKEKSKKLPIQGLTMDLLSQ